MLPSLLVCHFLGKFHRARLDRKSFLRSSSAARYGSVSLLITLCRTRNCFKADDSRAGFTSRCYSCKTSSALALLLRRDQCSHFPLRDTTICVPLSVPWKGRPRFTKPALRTSCSHKNLMACSTTSPPAACRFHGTSGTKY